MFPSIGKESILAWLGCLNISLIKIITSSWFTDITVALYLFPPLINFDKRSPILGSICPIYCPDSLFIFNISLSVIISSFCPADKDINILEEAKLTKVVVVISVLFSTDISIFEGKVFLGSFDFIASFHLPCIA